MLCYTILYYTILYYTILYYTILYYTILYYTILHCILLCNTMSSYFIVVVLLCTASLPCRGRNEMKTELTKLQAEPVYGPSCVNKVIETFIDVV